MRTPKKALVAAVAVSALSVTACGEEDDGADTAAGLTEAPIVIAVNTFLDTPVGSNPEVFGAAQAAALAINEAGGVNDRPIEIITCNDQFSANEATACARQAVDEEAVAYTGFSIFGPAIYPTLEPAGIPSTLFPVTALDVTGALQFPLSGGGISSFFGQPYAAVEAGAESAVLVVPETPGYESVIANEQAAAEAVGLEIKDVILVPNSQTTFDGTVQQLKELDADAVILQLNSGAQALLTQAAAALDYAPTWISYWGTFNLESFQLVAQNTETLWLTGALPPATAGADFEGIAQFNEEMDAAADAGFEFTEEEIRSEVAVYSWLQIRGIAEVAATIEGEVTAASLAEALRETTDIDLFGLVSWSPGGEPGPEGYAGVRDGGAVYVGPEGDGVWTPESEAVEMFPLLEDA